MPWARGKGKSVLERIFPLGKLIYPCRATKSVPRHRSCFGWQPALRNFWSSSAHNAQGSASCLYAKQFKFQVSCANPLMPLWHILGSFVWREPHLTLSIFTHCKSKWAMWWQAQRKKKTQRFYFCVHILSSLLALPKICLSLCLNRDLQLHRVGVR